MKCMITVGNKSNDLDFLRFAYEHGVRDYRINMDYAKDIPAAFDNISKLEKKDVNIYADFQGDKFRINIADKQEERIVHLGEKIRFHFYDNANVNSKFNFVTHIENQKEKLSTGTLVSISDGKLMAEIETVEENYFDIIFTKVDYVLRNNTGICFLGKDVPFMSINVDVCGRILGILQSGNLLMPDWVILSFVDSREAIEKFVDNAHSLGVKVMAKIETPQGVNNIKSISQAADGLMLGRGDLRNTTGDSYSSVYSQALKELKECSPILFKGIGTFFLGNYSETKSITNDELLDIYTVFKGRCDFFMLSKEVVNSKFPYETILKAEEIIKGLIYDCCD